jgi:anti-sigma factor RsiW
MPTSACLTFGELADYWTSDLTSSETERIEAHVFECADCAARLAESERLRTRLRDTIRTGAFHAVITDSVLNRLSRDGVRVRAYTIDPGDRLECAVWADDEVLVARLRGDFTGLSSVSSVMRLDTGEEVDRVVDAPVRDGSRELLFALSAEGIRHGPNAPMRLTVTAGPDPQGRDVLAEYVFDHRGTHDRSTRPSR